MLNATCKHCKLPISYRQGDNGLWYEVTSEPQLGVQYCWMDPARGSRRHEPDPDTIRDDTRKGGEEQG